MLKIDSIDKLRRIYDNACATDKALFAEQRTNIKLRNNDHYNSTTKKIVDNMRSKGVVEQEQKIRITKNHCHRITDEYINAILSRNPDISCSPYNDKELQHVKDAEMCNSVIKWIKETNDWDQMNQDFIHNTNVIGETYATIHFDYSKGKEIGIDNSGETQYAGEMVIKERYAYDTKRDPEAKTFKDCRYVMFDELVDKASAIEIVKKHNPEKVSSLVDAQEGDTVMIFDNNTGKYQQESARVLFIEMFIRPCEDYPKGQFIMFTKDFEIMRKELPLGIFPVYQSGFSKITGTPRNSSIIRVIRPYQIEINRASSKMAEHQITLGDDKVFLNNSAKIRNTVKSAGVRFYSVDGNTQPTVFSGRTGAQYLDYVVSELSGMYQAANVGYLMSDKPVGGDAYSLLFQTMKQKAVFVNYISRYESFLKNMFKDLIRLSKHYLDEAHYIKVLGKNELLNIAEFKDVDDSVMDITVESSNGDIETKFGKVLTITNVLQYAGSSMSQDQIGTLIKQLPYGNKNEIFNPLTINYDMATNIILSLDRGETPIVPKYAKLDFLLDAIAGRTVKADFQSLSPQIQQNYYGLMMQLEQTKSAQLFQAQQAQRGIIPSGGFLTTINASWKNPSTGKVERIKAPSESIEWLMTQLSQQGSFVQSLEGHVPQIQAEIGQEMQQSNNGQTIEPQAQEVQQ